MPSRINDSCLHGSYTAFIAVCSIHTVGLLALIFIGRLMSLRVSFGLVLASLLIGLLVTLSIFIRRRLEHAPHNAPIKEISEEAGRLSRLGVPRGHRREWQIDLQGAGSLFRFILPRKVQERAF